MSNEFSFKCVLVGDSQVGKTSIVQRMVGNPFSEKMSPTVGGDYFSTKTEYNGQELKLCFWDTAGQEIFNSLTRNYLRGASCVLLVFSHQNKDSFNNLGIWKETIDDVLDPSVPVIVIGNKSDIMDPENTGITAEKIDEYLNNNQLNHYYETSAKNGTGIEELKECVAMLVMETYMENQKIQVSLNQNTSNSSGCNC